MSASLQALLHPESVAIIGASNTASRIGGRPISNLLARGFKGAILPVNPKYETVQGLAAYPSILDTPGPVDCAIVAVPAEVTVDTLRDCAAAGVRSAILFTSGFAELDEAGAALQREISAIARGAGMRLIGPNCIGLMSVQDEWYGTFASFPSMAPIKSGPVGIVSQSGAYGSHVFMTAQQRGIGICQWVTTGNEADVDVAEVIAHYATEPEVEVIVAYAEGTRDVQKMRRALEAARSARKPVVFMKVGRSEAGAAAAASHTASLAGRDALYDALFRQCGVYRADTTEELLDVAYACQFGRFPRGRRVSLQTISGGVGVHMADVAEAGGLEVAPLADDCQARIKSLIPFAGTRNPVDFTGKALADPKLMAEITDIVISDGGYDSHLIYAASLPMAPFTRESCEAIFSRMRERYPEAMLLMSLIAPAEIAAFYENLGIPCFEDPALAVRALRALSHFGEIFARDSHPAPQPPKAGLSVPRRALSEYEGKKIIASWGIPVTDDRLVHSAEEAAAAWREIDGPAVLKIASPDILHKTEIGGVVLNVETADAAADAYDTLIQRVRIARPDLDASAVIVAPMIEGGLETVLGVSNDPLFGPVVMFGLGGILVEVLHDVTFRLAPFGEAEALRMIDEIRSRAVLDGVRGADPVDVQALARALSRLSIFAAENAHAIESADVNPFVLFKTGATALDALVIPRQQ